METQPIRALLIEDNIADAEVVREMLGIVGTRFEIEVAKRLKERQRFRIGQRGQIADRLAVEGVAHRNFGELAADGARKIGSRDHE